MKKIFHFQPLKNQPKLGLVTLWLRRVSDGIGFRQNPSIWNEVLLVFPGNIRWYSPRKYGAKSVFVHGSSRHIVNESNNPKIAWKKKHILSYPFLNSCFWPWIFLDLSAQHRPFGLGVGFVGEFVSSETKVGTTYGRCRYVIHASKFKSQQANRTSNMVGCPYSCNAIVTTRMSQLIFSFATIYWERWPNPNIASLSKQLKLPYHHLPPQNFKPIGLWYRVLHWPEMGKLGAKDKNRSKFDTKNSGVDINKSP